MHLLNGSNEVVFAVLASSIALVCIFGPVIFMEGIVGRFFESFAIVVTSGSSCFISRFTYINPNAMFKILRKKRKTN